MISNLFKNHKKKTVVLFSNKFLWFNLEILILCAYVSNHIKHLCFRKQHNCSFIFLSFVHLTKKWKWTLIATFLHILNCQVLTYHFINVLQWSCYMQAIQDKFNKHANNYWVWYRTFPVPLCLQKYQWEFESNQNT